jgi:hypothetical protein
VLIGSDGTTAGAAGRENDRCCCGAVGPIDWGLWAGVLIGSDGTTVGAADAEFGRENDR